MAIQNKKNKNKFSEQQYEDAYPDGIQYTYWNLARCWIINDVLKETGDAIAAATSSKILDIGCGRGIVVQAIRSFGEEVWGCDIGAPKISDAISRYIYANSSYKEIPSSLIDIIDTVLLLDVIEHIADPTAFIAELRLCFPKLKRIIVTVPARQELWSNYDEYFGHYLRYDYRLLQNQLHKAGYSVRLCRYFFKSLYIPAWLLIRFGKRRKLQLSVPRSIWYHRVVARCLFAEYIVLKKFGLLAGTSLIAVAEC